MHADTEWNSDHLGEGALNDEKGIIEPDVLEDILARLDLELACTSEKLGNLDLYIANISLLESNVGALSMENDDVSAEETEKALMFDLSLSYLDSEVAELEILLNSIEAQMLAIQQNILSCESMGRLVTILQAKLHASERFLEQSQDQLVEIKKQLGKLHKTLSNLEPENCKPLKLFKEKIGLFLTDMRKTFKMTSFFTVNICIAAAYMLKDADCEGMKLKLQTTEQQRIVLRMLEKSIAQELDLEKKLSESKENEEALKSKLYLAEQVVSCVEARAEVAWERLLEAENAAEVFKGVAKEMLCRLQIVQFSLNGSLLREEELKFELQNCLNQFKDQSANANEDSEDRNEMNALKENVIMLEEKLKESESRHKRANMLNEANLGQLSEMQHKIEMLRESVFVAESRADDADAKLTALTETNMELTEELGFLKGAADIKDEKISLLEKQVSKLENQLQHAKASSEASQEQQNMLYSAIWDMETLIEDLKSRVSKAETRAENAEEQCLMLAESNMELNKETCYLKSRTESLQRSLTEADRMKKVRAKEINSGTSLITDLVMQLANERDRIHKQLNSLARQNKLLTEELWGSKKKVSVTRPVDKGGDENEAVEEQTYNSASTTSKEASSTKEPTEPTSTSNRADEPSEGGIENKTAVGSSQLDGDAVGDLSKHEQSGKRSWYLNIKYVFMAMVFVLAGLALHMYQDYIISTFRNRHGQQW
ncbi:hypothetical protein Ancab_020949 [Ancistrocladus abbreviatus]